MKIAGFRPLSLIDFPSLPCSVIFTVGCNFKCPWCHNWRISHRTDVDTLDVDEVISILVDRKEDVRAVCITGGEPTLQNDLKSFVKILKLHGFKIKLDTNGSKPDAVEDLLDLLDYFAVDIKASPENYPKLTGVKKNYWKEVEETVKIIRKSGIGYELRMTYVPELSSPEDLEFLKSFTNGDERVFVTLARETEIFKVRGSLPTFDFGHIVVR